MYGGALVAYLITNSLLVGAWLAIMQAYRRKKYLWFDYGQNVSTTR